MPSPTPISWASVPNKGELAIICSVRLADFIQQAVLQTVMFYQLADFAPELNEDQISRQVGVLQGAFTAAQVVTAVYLGRLADNPRCGRKGVILLGLLGQAFSCVAVGLSRSFLTAVVWRTLGGAINGTVGGARTALSEKTERKYHSRTFLLLPLAWNIANIIGPPVAGLLSDPVKYYPRYFSETSWLSSLPYALPNIACALVLVIDALIVFLGYEETLPAAADSRDVGLEIGSALKSFLARGNFAAVGYVPLEQHTALSHTDIELEQPPDLPLHSGHALIPATPKAMPNTNIVSEGSLKSILTVPVLHVFATVGALDFHLAGFLGLWTILLSSEKPSSKFHGLQFTGGLGFSPYAVGVAISLLGIAGIVFQFTFYPRFNAKYGLLGTMRYSFLLFPITYLVAPCLALVAHLPSVLWPSMVIVVCMAISARTFATPGSVLLVNNAAPSPRVLGTMHGFGAAWSSGMRTLGPILASYVYAAGLKHNTIVEGWYFLAIVATLGCVLIFTLREKS